MLELFVVMQKVIFPFVLFAGSIKTDQVIQKVSALFAENEHLIMEFTNFLPCENGK